VIIQKAGLVLRSNPKNSANLLPNPSETFDSDMTTFPFNYLEAFSKIFLKAVVSSLTSENKANKESLALEKITSAAFWSKSIIVLIELASTKASNCSAAISSSKLFCPSSKFLNKETLEALSSALIASSKVWAKVTSSNPEATFKKV